MVSPSLHAQLVSHRVELTQAIAALGGTNLRVFGSVARGDDRPDSDIDLLVDIDETVGLIQLGRMRTVAELLLGAPVDIVPSDGLKPELRDAVLRDARPL